ncbi:MAG: PPC domain-containing protein, partial [Acidiferrobacterales bacterium]|nr:PPC domain-containing protein [Acidiferrobacterales bacterium]
MNAAQPMYRLRTTCRHALVLLVGAVSLTASAESAYADLLPVRAKSGDTFIKLAWDPPPNQLVKAYRVYRQGEKNPLGEVTQPEIEDIGLSNDRTYIYVVTAVLVDDTEWKGYEPVSAIPGATEVVKTEDQKGAPPSSECASIMHVASGTAIEETINSSARKDCYTFEGKAGEQVTVYVDNRTTAGSRKLGLALLGPDGAELARADSQHGN